jgi:hypothetical protein
MPLMKERMYLWVCFHSYYLLQLLFPLHLFDNVAFIALFYLFILLVYFFCVFLSLISLATAAAAPNLRASPP